MVGAGTQHVVVLTSDSQDHQNLPLFTEEVLNFRLPAPEPKPAKAPAAPRQAAKKLVKQPKSKEGSHAEADHEMVV